MTRDAAPRPPRDVVLVVLGLVTFAAGALIAVGGPPGTFETTVFRRVNAWPDAVSIPIVAVMQFGAFFAVPVVAAVAWARRRRRLAVDLLAAGWLGWGLTNLVLKPLFGRGRPEVLLEDVVIRSGVVGGLGFPSGHTTVAAALATVLAPALPPRWRWLPWLAALAVAIARLYVGVHLPGDVIGGFGLGVAVAAGWRLLDRRVDASR